MKFLPISVSLLLLFLLPVIALHAQDTSEEIRTIKITGSDQMKFDVTEINATPGEEIKIVLTTESNLPKEAMAHNAIVLRQDTDAKAFASVAATAKNNDFIPPKLTDQIIAYTDLAGGGETVEVTFTIPEEAGSYTYICSFPGHFAAGMKGTIMVK